MSDDLVKRFSSYNIMMLGESGKEVPTPSGDWVKYKDYKAASDRIEELELAVRYEADLAQQALDAREELEAELHTMKTAGIIEVSIRNPNVSEYMAHWERRAEGAEAKLRESALQELSALGQASEAYQGQLAAEARIVDLEAKLDQAQWLLIDALVQLREGKIKTRRNRADLIDRFLEELKEQDDAIC